MLVRDGKLLGRVPYAFVIVGCCCLLQAFGMGLILNCGSLFYVPVCEDMGFLRSEIATYMTGYFVGTTLVTPLAGKLLSRYDIRVVMALAIVVLSFSVGVMSTYTAIWQWQASGFLVGAAGSCIFVLPSATLVGNWFVKRRGMVYGIVMACSSVSAAVFSQVLHGIIVADGWREAYLFVGVASFCVIFPCALLLRRNPSDVGAVPYGLVPNKVVGKASVVRGVAVKVAVVSLAFWCLFVFAGIASFIHGGIEQHLPGYVESVGFTSSFAAAVVSAQSVGSVVDKLVMGWLNDKLGVQRTTIIELVLIVLGILGFVLLHNPVFLIVSAVLFGVQDSLMSVSLPLLIREVFGSKNYTQIHAWIRTGVGVFGSFSGIVVGAAYDFAGTFVPAFLGLMVICFFAMACIRVAYRTSKGLVWEATGCVSDGDAKK